MTVIVKQELVLSLCGNSTTFQVLLTNHNVLSALEKNLSWKTEVSLHKKKSHDVLNDTIWREYVCELNNQHKTKIKYNQGDYNTFCRTWTKHFHCNSYKVPKIWSPVTKKKLVLLFQTCYFMSSKCSFFL